MSKKSIIKQFGPFHLFKDTSNYGYVSIVDTRTNKRLFGTYRSTNVKDPKKFVKSKINAKLKNLDKALARLFQDIEKVQKDQMLWEEFQQTVENPPPMTLEEIFNENKTS